jgi:hypothetical protein
VVEGSCLGFASRTEAFFKQMDHVYHMKWWRRVSALLILPLAGVVCIASWREPKFSPQNPNLFVLVLSGIVLLAGIYQIANAFISTVTLFADSVEVRTAFGRQSLLFGQIRGRREYVSGIGRSRTPYFSLVPNDDQLYTLAFVQAFNFDEAFLRWFNHLPDLDAADEKLEKESKAGLG